MKLLGSITFLAALAVALGQPDPTLDWHWQLWKKTHGKQYRHEVGASRRGGSGTWVPPQRDHPLHLGVPTGWVLPRRDHPLRPVVLMGCVLPWCDHLLRPVVLMGWVLPRRDHPLRPVVLMGWVLLRCDHPLRLGVPTGWVLPWCDHLLHLGVLTGWVLPRRDHPLRPVAGRGAEGSLGLGWSLGLPAAFGGVRCGGTGAGAAAARHGAAFRRRKGSDARRGRGTCAW